MNILNVEKVSKTYGEKQLFDEVTLVSTKATKSVLSVSTARENLHF